MATLVAFLRGINVGGHTAKNEELERVFKKLGFQSASAFRQSGNIVFESGRVSGDTARLRLESGLREALGYDVAVLIRKLSDLKEIMRSAPTELGETREASYLVTLLPNPLTRFPVALPTIIPKSSAEIVSHSGSEVFSITHGGGEGGLPNPFLESLLEVKATTRNLNVIREIVERYGQYH
jgi:uncharacterized protein (DUF1697 family)